jgi:hypothetical protein
MGFVYQPTEHKLYFALKNQGSYEMNTQQLQLKKLNAESTGALKGLISKKDHGEIDFLNGYIVRRGLAHQIPTPANQSVYALGYRS